MLRHHCLVQLGLNRIPKRSIGFTFLDIDDFTNDPQPVVTWKY
jgi:hypothetical protein